MTKIDFKKEFKQFYRPKQKEELVVIPVFNYLMIDGEDATLGSEQFQLSIQALFAVSYKAKFLSKSKLNRDYTVMPLEGLWWADNMDDFISGKKENWKWTLMIFQPSFISLEIIDEAIIENQKKKLKLLDKIRLEKYEEGKSAQIMHIGPFSEEHSNIQKIHNLILENGGEIDGKKRKHHEIYLSDFRKCDPAKMKTIIRQPYS